MRVRCDLNFLGDILDTAARIADAAQNEQLIVDALSGRKVHLPLSIKKQELVNDSAAESIASTSLRKIISPSPSKKTNKANGSNKKQRALCWTSW